jgi:DNA-directed RNA polymerase subunit RPC12/RpoP
MHPDIISDIADKCPRCGMNLEKKRVLLTYACPEKDCGIEKSKPGLCSHHNRDLVKTAVRYHCPRCGAPVSPEELKLKPLK